MINISRGPLGIYAPVFNNKIEPTVVVADFRSNGQLRVWAGYMMKV